jgi:hypothetical protein
MEELKTITHMESKEIEAGNRIIAEFMGAVEQTAPVKMSTIGSASAPTGKMHFKDVTTRFPDFMYTCKIEDLKYHTSFEWIMPVVFKTGERGLWTLRPDYAAIQSYKAVTEKKNQFMFISSQMDWEREDGEPVEWVFIIFSVVVQFITWYNSQSHQQTSKKEEK